MHDSDDHDVPAGARLQPAVVRELCTLSPAISLLHLGLEWAAIVGISVITWQHLNPITYLIAVPLLGARQHSLIVLMHEGAHYRLLRSRFWNDVVAEAFTAFPFLLFTMRDYRKNHLRHHHHLNTDGDPDWVRKRGDAWTFPQPRRALAWMFARDLMGWGFAQFLLITLRLPRRAPDERALRAARWAFFATLAATVVAMKIAIPFVLFWIVPMATWMQVAFHLRSIAEHHGIAQPPSPHSHTRTVLVGPLERLFIGCKNVNYHLEHHLYPGVPFYRLPTLHRLLMADPAYRRNAPIRGGYWAVLRECAALHAPRLPMTENVSSGIQP
jgi:fatty acid desaturase